MGTVSDKLTYLNTTKTQIREKINDLGQELDENDTFRSYEEALENIYEDYPKITATDTEASLNNTKAGKMKVDLKGNTSQATLPTGYTPLDYIKFNGKDSTWINTEVVIGSNTNIKVQTKIEVTTTEQDVNIFNAWILSSNTFTPYRYYGLTAYNNKFYFGSNGSEGNAGTYSPTVGSQYEITYNDNGKIIVNKETIYENLDGKLPWNSNLYIGKRGESSVRGSYFKYFYFKVWDGATLLRDMIPCKNSSNVLGMYDLVTKTFYQNAGTGTFTAGNDVTRPNPNYPIDIQTVSGNNTITISNSDGTEEQNLPVNLKSKNLFDSNNITKLIKNGTSSTNGITNQNGIITISYTNGQHGSYAMDYLMPIKEGKVAISFKALLSGSNSSNEILVTLFDSTGTNDATSAVKLIATEKNNWYEYTVICELNNYANNGINLDIQAWNTGNTIQLKEIQLEQGQVATAYEPYYNYELCKIGTAQDYFYKDSGKWYLHKETNSQVLTGNENWGTQNNCYRTEDFTDIKTTNNTSDIVVICSHFPGSVTNYRDVITEGTVAKVIGSNYQIVFKITNEFATQELFTTFLSNNTVTIKYMIETPTNTEITETSLINQLEAILTAKSYNEQTNISQTNSDLPFILDIKALRGE